MDQVKPIRFFTLLVLLSGLIAYTYTLRYRSIEEPLPPALELIPIRIGNHIGTDNYLDPETIRMFGADSTIFRSYNNKSGREIQLFLGFFGSQQENSQIHSPKNCYPGSGWNILVDGSTRLRLRKGTVPVKRLLISDGREKQIVIYWFSTQSAIITNEFTLKWHQMKSALLGKSQSVAFVRFSTKVPYGEDDISHEDLIRFAEAVSPHIEMTLYGSSSAKNSAGRTNHRVTYNKTAIMTTERLEPSNETDNPEGVR